MPEDKIFRLAIKCISIEARKLHMYYLRYEKEPTLWPEWKNAHDRYLEYQQAIEYFEAKFQRKLPI